METSIGYVNIRNTGPVYTKITDASSSSSAPAYFDRQPDTSKVTPFFVPLDIKESGKGEVEYRLFQPILASDFLSRYLSIFTENNILKEIVKNQWFTIQYNKEYSAYLLGQYSEDEFFEMADKFAIEPKIDIDDKTFFTWMKIIFKTLNERLTSSDLSILTNIDCSLIESKLSGSDPSNITS